MSVTLFGVGSCTSWWSGPGVCGSARVAAVVSLVALFGCSRSFVAAGSGRREACQAAGSDPAEQFPQVVGSGEEQPFPAGAVEAAQQ